MEYFHVHQRLLLISVFFLVSTLATEPISSPGASPNPQPVSSPSAEPESSPNTSPTLPPLSHVSFPPSGSDAPSPLISPSSSLDSPESLEDSSDVPEDSPEGQDGLEDSPEGEDGPEDSSPDSEDYPEGPDGEVPFSGRSQPSESETAREDSPAESSPKVEKTNANSEVKKVCGTTDYPSLCINTIDPLVKPKKEVTLDTVLEVSIKATNDLAKAAKVMATKLASAPGTPPELATVLKDCKESYDDALDNFQKAMDAYDTRDIGSMNTMLSAVITGVGDCEDEFNSLNIPSPVAEFAQKLTNMTSNCLAIVSLLQY